MSMHKEQHQQDQILSFIAEIDTIRREDSLSYMDAIVSYCEKNFVEIETIADFIKNVPKLKFMIEQEAEELNYFEKKTRLPL